MTTTLSREKAQRVLIVDDHADLSSMVCALLEQRGYKCETVRSRDDAFDAIVGFDPHVVLVELALRRERTDNLIRDLRARSSRSLLIIVVSIAEEPE